MKSVYVNTESFGDTEAAFFERATVLIDVLPDDLEGKLRCHELSRAVGTILELPVQDGEYGHGCEHSWLWTPCGNILDVSCIYRLPQVQLIKRGFPTAEQGRLYRGGPPRVDINQDVVENLIAIFRTVP